MKSPHAIRPVLLYSEDKLYSPTSQCDCDGGDCACSLPTVASYGKTDPSSLSLSELRRSAGSQEQLLNDSYYIVFGPFHKPVVLNEVARNLLTAFDEPEHVYSYLQPYTEQQSGVYIWPFIQAMYSKGLLAKQDERPALTNNPQTLTVWMHITDRCNLRCSYCYLPHLKKDMSATIGYAAIDASLRSALIHGYSRLKLKYAGGEPLLCFETLMEIHRYALEQGARHNITVEGVVLSNGTLLTVEKAHTIRGYGLRLMISLDGLGETHNAQRPYASGRNTFEDVVQGIEVALASDITPDISITATGKSANNLPQIVEWVLKRKLPFSLNFYRESELSATFSELRLEEKTIINGMLAAYDIIEQRLPSHSLLGSLVDRANLGGAHLKTCGVGDNYMVFDYQGRVAKCQMLLHKTVTSVAVYDPLAIVRTEQDVLRNLSVEEKEGCKSCEWKYWCTGGCSLATFRATGRYDVNSPNCHIYKSLYPRAMRLEGLRLLRYGLSLDL